MALELTWSTITLPAAAAVRGAAYGNGVYVVAMYNKGYCYTSTDLLTWTQRALPSTRTWGAIAYGNGVFVMIPQSGQPAVCAISADGISWTEHQISIFGFANGAAVVFGDGIFVVSRSSNGKNMNISPDGVTWSSGVATTTHNIWGLAWSGDEFVACGPSTVDSASQASVSNDGINFTTHETGAPDFRGVLLARGDVFVLPPTVDGGTHAYVSTNNGAAWSAQTLPVPGNYQPVGFVGTDFVLAASGEDYILVSPDGSDWVEYAAPGPLAYRPIATANGASFYVDALDQTKMYIATYIEVGPFWTDLINCEAA